MRLKVGTLYKASYLTTGHEFYAFITKTPEDGLGLVDFYDIQFPEHMMHMGMASAIFFFKEKNCLTKLK